MDKELSHNPASPGRICVAVASENTESAISVVKPLEGEIDVVEIRLDAMREFSVPRLCRSINRPLLFTNRPTWEGGHCSAPDPERIEPLLEAVGAGAAFIDLELKTDQRYREQLLAAMNGSPTRMIISHHDFEKTPDAGALASILQQQAGSGAHIGKIVTMAHSHSDVLRVLNLQCQAREQNFSLIAFCMGAAGKLSRILTLLLGGFMTYAALDEHQATAPGQLTVLQIKKTLADLEEYKT